MNHLEFYLTHLQRFGIKPGLERMRALLALAERPEASYPVLLVGGTNGKGSTCEFLARTLCSAGKKVGLYTSPHLYNWNERIRVLQANIDPGALFPGQATDQELDTLLAQAMPHIEAVAQTLGQPTEFEVMTLLGLWHFQRQGVDAAIVEVGLGGHYDATNVTDPLVSVVTHVALDHCDRLGSTLEAIGADKVHIARPNRALVTGATHAGVLRVLANHCQSVGAHLVQVAPNPRATDFQTTNWRIAATAGEAFCRSLGWAIDWTGPVPVEVPGRFETIATQPELILDAANNPDGALQLVELVRAQARIPKENLVLVLGILADKDYAAMTQILAPLARTVIVTQSQSPRAASTQDLAPVARQHCADVQTIATVPEAVKHARTLAGPQDTILVTGSFTTIAEVER